MADTQFGPSPAAVGPWLRRISAANGAAQRLVCFGHAGSSHSDFGGWKHHLDPSTELMAACLPGRRERYDEEPRRSVDPMAGEIADAICALPQMPTTLFGHSFGAILAYEVAQQIERRAPGRLGALVVSACARSAATALDGVDETDEAAVLAAFIKRGYLAPEHVENNKLIELVLPYLLGDVLCKKRWQSDTWPPLCTPIHTLVWTDDQLVHPTSVQNWHAFSARPKSCRHFEFPGAHLEYLSQPLPMFDALNGILAHVLSEPGDPETLSKEAQRHVG